MKKNKIMEPKLNFSHICDYASPGEKGKLNILGIFENIFSNTPGYIHPQLYVVTNIGVSKSGNFKQLIKIVREKDNVEITKPLEFDVPIATMGDSQKPINVGFIGQFNGIKFEEFGMYLVQIFVDGIKIGENKLSVAPIPERK